MKLFAGRRILAPMDTLAPHLTAAELTALESKYGAPNYAPIDVVITSASGVWAHDIDGKRYLDCISAYSAVNQGHGHPRILAALIEQAKRLTLTSRAVRNDQMPLLLRDLTAYCEQEMAILMNTGAEAVETAIKLARRWGYRIKGIPLNRARIIVCLGNFHGRTTTVVSASSVQQYRTDFGPFTPGFDLVPYGDIDALRRAFTDETCALLIEPIQGEGGVIVPPPGYLKAAMALCRERHALFLDDEIQTGFGRCGDRLAVDHDGIKPDVVMVGKALGGGFYPVSAVLASRELLELFKAGDHGSTFGGNPLGCAVAREALAVIVDEHLAERSRTLGAELMARIEGLKHPLVREVRGRGLLIGIELTVPAKYVSKALLREGILAKDTQDTVLRIAPPLVIERAQLEVIVTALSRALDAVAAA
ncbi:MAG TPA: ornithine--oxo-acid transaminase [Candidatus Baltobacteraceae bacterium]